jgi:type IV pilus assembly protein PilM
MSSPRTRIVTLNLGSQVVELAVFHVQPQGRLILTGYASRDLLPEPGAEAARPGQVVAALRELMRELEVAGGDVVYTVAEEAVFSRFVKLPAIAQEKIGRIVAFEAQQNVPFPLDEVVWDYQVVDGGLGEEVQVVLVAIKADLLDGINRVVEETGLHPTIVDVATMALYNAFLHNYADREGSSLLIDMGARTTNFLFVEPGRFFTRSVPIGGWSITAAIAKEFNEPFAAAELRKKRDGSLGPDSGTTDSLKTDVGRVAQVVRGTMTRLHGELLRSISHYCGQHSGRAPAQVFLSGGVAGTPAIEQFFSDKLRIPVEFFNPLRDADTGEFANLAEVRRCAYLLGEPVGLALRASARCPIELNLRPASVVRRETAQNRRPFLIAAAACFILGVLAWGVYFARAAQVHSQAAARLEEKVAVMRRVETQMNRVRKETTAFDNDSAQLVAAITERSFWPLLLEDLNSRLPKEDIWITELVPTSGGKPVPASQARPSATAASPASATPALRQSGAPGAAAIDGLLLRGLYLFNPKQQEVVVDYFRNLVGSPWFAIDPNNQGKVMKPTTPDNTEWAFPYELHLDLKKPLPLP